MTAFESCYRMTIFSPKEIDLTESTVLTPASDADHSDSFKVATKTGITGFQPYLGFPQGRKAQFNPLDKKSTIGSLAFDLYDFKTGTDNAVRWVTAFVGDSKGYARLKGLKAYVEESLDGGSSWSPYFVGYTTDFSLNGALKFSVVIRDASDALKTKIFTRQPHSSITYNAKPMLLPVGLDGAYGDVEATDYFTGTFDREDTTYGILRIPNDEGYRRDNILGAAFGNKPYNLSVTGGGLMSQLAKMRAISDTYSDFKVTVFTTAGVEIGSYSLFHIETRPWMWLQKPRAAKNLYIKELPDSHPEYAELGDLSDEGTYQFAVYPLETATISENNPLLLNDVHPVKFLEDICSGSFGPLYVEDEVNKLPAGKNVGDRIVELPMSASTFTTLKAKNLYDSRWRITKSYPLNEFVEKYLCQVYHIGYRIDPAVVSGVPKGVISVFDCHPPSSTTGLVTITDADLVAGKTPTWEPTSPLGTLSLKYYQDDYPSLEDLVVEQEDAEFPEIPFGGIEEIEEPVIHMDLRRLDAGVTDMTIDAIGIRGYEFEWKRSTSSMIGSFQAVRYNVADPYKERFSNGPANVTLYCLRTSNTSAVKIGDWCIIAVPVLPNPQTHARGGSRIMQCTERSENGLTLTLRFSDLGQNATLTAPNITSFVSSSTDPYNTVQMTYTTTVTGSVQAWYAVTETSASSRPAEEDSTWVLGNTTYRTPGTYTVVFPGILSGKKVWGRARTLNAPGQTQKLPSDWDYPTNNYTFTRGMTAPTGLAISDITATTAHVSWSNAGDETAYTEIYMASPSTGSLDYFTRVVGGVSEYDLFGLNTGSASNPYKVAIRHSNLYGSVSAFVSGTFTASGSAPTAPSLTRFYVHPDGGLQ